MNRIISGIFISFALLATGCSSAATSQAVSAPLNLPSPPASSSAVISSASPSTSKAAVAEGTKTCPSTSDLIKDRSPADPKPPGDLIAVAYDPPVVETGGPYVLPYCEGGSVDARQSYDPQGAIKGWEWDLNGDGTMECPYNYYGFCPIGNLPEGEYTATVLVTNDLGLTVPGTTTLMVAPAGTTALTGKPAAAYIKKHSTKPVINVSKNIKVFPASTNGSGFLEPYLFAWKPKEPLTFPTGYLLLVSGYGYGTIAKLTTTENVLSYNGIGENRHTFPYMRFCKPGNYTLVVAEPKKKTRTIRMTVTGPDICSQGMDKPPLLPEPEQGQG